MKSLVNDLLDFAQLSNGKFRKVEENFNIRKTINEVIRIQEYKAMKKGVKIKTVFSNFGDGLIVDENPSHSNFDI
jgi:signal transduction histidine kinase